MSALPTRAPAASASGVYASLESLLKLRAFAGAVHVSATTRARSQLSGPRSSNARGRGIEFEEVRNYAPGDDVRTIDWRVTARKGRTHTKVFREERERPVLMMVDQRTPMFFGSRRTLKSVQALHTAALIAWATLDAGDRVGGLAFGNRELHEVRPRRSHRAVIALLRQCHRLHAQLARPADGADAPRRTLAEALAHLRRIARPGTHLWLISDFHDLDAEADRQLHLLARHCEISGLFVHDALEIELPASGRGIVTDGVRRALLDTASSQARQRYAQASQRHREFVTTCFNRLGAPLIALATDASAMDVLGRRSRRIPRR